MQFHSYGFLFFFPVVLLSTWILPKKWRNALLLLASYLFYASWGAGACLVLLGCTVLSYLAGLLMEKRKWVFPASLLLIFGVLGVYKYTGFLLSNLSRLGLSVNGGFSLAAPVGISFFTFQTAGYLMDVAKGKYPPERSFLRFALFVSFFPQILTGPIGRGDQLLPQYEQCRKPSYDDLRAGFLTMTWGFFQKLVIADRAAMLVDTVYDGYLGYSGACLALATVVYAVQIYCDFSGCTCMAIGAARMLGIRLGTNFLSPYFSASIPEFWRRWHISLSTWFRDYVYFPLGGSRCSRWKVCRNLLLVFLISGLWHGASWGFLAWGLIHGCYQIFGRLTAPMRKDLRTRLHVDDASHGYRLVCVLWTFLLVCAAWVFFRADRLGSAVQILLRMLTQFQLRSLPAVILDGSLGLDLPDTLVLVFGSLILFAVDRARYHGTDLQGWFWQRGTLARVLMLAGLMLATLFLGIWGNGFHASSFIYAQF